MGLHIYYFLTFFLLKAVNSTSITNKESIDMYLIQRAAIHSFHTYNPNEKNHLIDEYFFNSEKNNVYGEIGFDEDIKHVIVAFRGTVLKGRSGILNLINIINNLSMQKIETEEICKNCKIHAGFIRSYFSIKDFFISELEKLIKKYSDYPITIVGHSLCGALATVMAADCYGLLFNKVNLVTFGRPRVGNEHFTKYIESLEGINYRITWGKDPVVTLPINTSGNYVHEINEINFNYKEDYSLKFGNEKTDTNSNFPNIFYVKDHGFYRELININKLSS